MILFDNGLIRLDFDPAFDILLVDMPNVNTIVLPEVKRALSIIVEYTRNYDVKKLLVDARKTEIDLDEVTYTAMISEFVKNLLATRLQKIARIVSSSTVRENVVKEVYQQNQVPLLLKSFTDKESGIEWLRS